MAITWRPPDDLEQRLDAAAFVTGRTKTDLLTDAVRQLLDNHPQADMIQRAQAAAEQWRDRETPPDSAPRTRGTRSKP